MGCYSEDAVGVLDGHTENGDAREAVAEGYPVRAAVGGFENADIGAGEEHICVSRVDRERIDRRVGNSAAGRIPCDAVEPA